ncbi:hypothetical protein HMI54_013948 [Coelomomyces lativittatus]|nr:hypothetical protein HMI56_007203 [Coelomomyces lativittatus]KAJ1514562.1 hypothetical protein HMI54_013948 [Coelomomyces lativittatus]KAJ1517858.1 hypothetical protein HMI55_005382 [Coelomomyces lativittatus]
MVNLLHDASTTPTGPFLAFRGTKDGVYTYSVMVIYPPTLAGMEPTMEVSVGQVIQRRLLASPFGYAFWRFTWRIPGFDEEQHPSYQVERCGPPHAFRVPGHRSRTSTLSDESRCRWVFFSCNGYSADISETRRQKYHGVQPLWQDVYHEHQQRGIHLLIGGGDQLYFDPLFEVVPGLNAWAKLKDRQLRLEAPFPKDMEDAVAWFYMNHYLHGFMDGILAQVLAEIPYCMAWDDHDIFDGYGSYPDYLQDSNVFKGIFQCALQFYLLFQHHTTPALAKTEDGYVGHEGYHKALTFGTDLMIVLPDTRTERSLRHVISPTSYGALFQQMESLTPPPQHVLFVSPIPMVYPHSKSDQLVKYVGQGFQWGASVMRGIGQVFQQEHQFRQFFENTKLYKSAVNRFGEPELLDDLLDHWTHRYHVTEKRVLLRQLQHHAQQYQARITLLSGDVHLAACGRLTRRSSFLKEDEEKVKEKVKVKGTHPTSSPSSPPPPPPTLPKDDPMAMFQIVSSGIGNLPPPPIVAWNLERSPLCIPFEEDCVEEMLPLFHPLPKSKSRKKKLTLHAKCHFLRRRNYALGELKVHPPPPLTSTNTTTTTTSSNALSMHVYICVEQQKGDPMGTTQRYLVDVPYVSTPPLMTTT